MARRHSCSPEPLLGLLYPQQPRVQVMQVKCSQSSFIGTPAGHHTGGGFSSAHPDRTRL